MVSESLPEGIHEVAVPPQPATAAGVLVRLKQIQRVFHEDPLATVAQPTGRPSEIDAALLDLKKGNDGVACFNHLYKVITAEIDNRITEGGFFHDNDFLNLFDVVFANRYFGAIQKYQDSSRDGPAPACWRLLFQNREDQDISPMQFAVDGVACHVWLDLPVALVQTCKTMGKPLDKDTHDDFQKVNYIFYEKIPRLRRHFEDPFERDFDRSILKHILNHLCDSIVVFSRDLSWYHAEELWKVWDPPGNAKFEKHENKLDKAASFVGHGILGVL
jgi:Family of unknown function (DUF5995)